MPQFPEFHEVKLPMQTGRHGGRLYACFGFCKAKTKSSKMAWMPFLSSARDRSGIFAEQKLERIARFFAVRGAAKNAPKYTGLTVFRRQDGEQPASGV
jgi:hypothetical protein